MGTLVFKDYGPPRCNCDCVCCDECTGCRPYRAATSRDGKWHLFGVSASDGIYVHPDYEVEAIEFIASTESIQKEEASLLLERSKGDLVSPIMSVRYQTWLEKIRVAIYGKPFSRHQWEIMERFALSPLAKKLWEEGGDVLSPERIAEIRKEVAE